MQFVSTNTSISITKFHFVLCQIQKNSLDFISTTEATDDFTKELEEKIMMTKQQDKFRDEIIKEKKDATTKAN